MSEHDIDETPVVDEPRASKPEPVLQTAKLDRPGGAKGKPDKQGKNASKSNGDKKPKDKRHDPAQAPEPTTSQARILTWPRVLVAGVLAGLLVVSALLGARVIHDRRIDSARATALSAAQQYATDFGTYDYQNLDARFALIANDLTGTFKSTYVSTAASLKATVIQYQERSTVAVQGAGVTSVSPHQAVVIVLFDQSVRSINSTTPVINRTRARITLVRSGGGRWLMSALDLK